MPARLAGDQVVFAAVSDSAGRTTLSDVPEQLRRELRLAGAKDVRLCVLPTDAINVIRGVDTGILWVSLPGCPAAWLPCPARACCFAGPARSLCWQCCWPRLHPGTAPPAACRC